MKTILCFGDSLTWGYDAETGLRHAFDDRWPNVLARALGEDVAVITDGLNGRTTVFDDHMVMGERNGAKTLPTALGAHQPLDLVVLMLGTNDLKRHTGGGRVFESRQGMERLVEIIQTYPYQRGYSVPKILIVAPPHFCQTTEPDFSLLFGHGIEESQHFRSACTKVAEEYGCAIFDAAEVCETTPLDGVHLDATHTRALGEALVEPVRALLAETA
ncbi:SGNH/GDSL hydrolase family protein [Aurantimonas endophytica]|uniref:Lysophospholipase L1-like esterase n=1 Tax=Aurantimonas endophytica TaxID=1522175 RepID=A0A7W6MN48_9HYPH|nr:SGNH/GDSL hydrolase family protein [Aurantimonas endophytica]MBB4001503.1 lysophospholipase L1-like esterase [Aurantimonas endophytica]MCO6402856.1 arylesterase [Aurantimonas endophytica]